MRDRDDNVVVVCSIENLDPMGVHTGDSITVAPAMTLTDREYQRLRDIGIDVIRAVGVDTGGCNIQFAVDPADRPGHRHRDEPAGLALERAGVEGHRLPDRQDRRQARHRLHPRRDPQRHHPRDAGLLRADPRLRRRQGAAVRVREVPRRRPDADDPHEERRRGDGDRPLLHRGAAEGAALAGAARRRAGLVGDRPGRRTWTGCSRGPRVPHDGRLRVVQQALRAGATVEQVHEATGIDPWFLDQIALLDERRGRRARRARARPRPAAPGQAARLLRRPARAAARAAGGRRARCAARPGHPAGLQDRRHLRRRVRGARRPTTTRPTTRRPRSRPASSRPC